MKVFDGDVKFYFRYFLYVRFCCAYLAFKIEEYNLSIDEFVQVLGDKFQDAVANTVLQNEVMQNVVPSLFHQSFIFFFIQLLMLKKLRFNLVVHSAFRPLEGFIIDLKVVAIFFLLQIQLILIQ